MESNSGKDCQLTSKAHDLETTWIVVSFVGGILGGLVIAWTVHYVRNCVETRHSLGFGIEEGICLIPLLFLEKHRKCKFPCMCWAINLISINFTNFSTDGTSARKTSCSNCVQPNAIELSCAIT